jgi:NAD(P)-dependent dehydrogenase (short-subunit alcohol dehydrogenase family)
MGLLDGKIALVTGGADGIGAATVRRLAAEGATVVVTDINGDGATQLAAAVGGLGICHDAGSESDWEQVMKQVREAYGRLAVLVNNAGVGGGGAGDIEGQPLADFHKVMRVCLDSTFIGCKLAIGLMKHHGGSIINVSSVLGIRAAGFETAYSTAKGGVRLLTKSVAQHCARSGYGIRVNSVHPGYVLTNQVKTWIDAQENSQAVLDGLLAQHPIGYLGTPADIANGIVFLACDQSRFMTGSELVMDGGYLL